MPKYKKDYVRLLVAASSLGIELAVSIIVGYFIGNYLDKLFNTGTTLTIIFILFGIAAGFMNLYRVSKAVQKDLNEHKLNDVYVSEKTEDDSRKKDAGKEL